MSDTLFNDVSEFQRPADASYPYAFLAFRSNDGTYRDSNFPVNLSLAKHNVRSQKFKGYITYFVWEENAEETVWTLKDRIGVPGPKLAVLIDVESWKGKLVGNHSAAINQSREEIISWLNKSRPALTRLLYKRRDRKRVIGYGNVGDLANLWPQRGDAKVIVAAYGSDPDAAGKIAHQFSSSFPSVPFGPCDINSADGRTADEFATQLGLDKIVHTIKKPKPIAIPKWPLTGGKFFGPGGLSGNGGNADTVAAIKLIQKRLVKHGFAGKIDHTAWIDGIYGPETEAAVKAFKAANKVRNKTGAIHRPAWRTLMKLG